MLNVQLFWILFIDAYNMLSLLSLLTSLSIFFSGVKSLFSCKGCLHPNTKYTWFFHQDCVVLLNTYCYP